MTPAAIAVAIAVPLAGWRLYMRMRRLRTRQRLGARRPWVNVVLTAVLVMVLGLIASSSPPAMAGLGVGVVAGGGLGLHALRRTVLEATPAGLFYTPGSRAGVLLGLLLGARIAWRAAELARMDTAVLVAGFPGQLASPSTLAVLGALAGYTGAYAAGLIHRRRAS